MYITDPRTREDYANNVGSNAALMYHECDAYAGAHIDVVSDLKIFASDIYGLGNKNSMRDGFLRNGDAYIISWVQGNIRTFAPIEQAFIAAFPNIVKPDRINA